MIDYFNNRSLFTNRENFGVPTSIDILNTRANKFNAFSSLVANRNVLDVAGCDGRWGAWCLDNNAKHVYGFDISPTYIAEANNTLSQYFNNSKFTYTTSSWQDYTPPVQMDVVLLFGILYFSPPELLIEKACSVANTILVDTSYNCKTVQGEYQLTLDYLINSFESRGYKITIENNDEVYTRIVFSAIK